MQEVYTMGYFTYRWLHEAPEDEEQQQAPANDTAEGEAPADDNAQEDEAEDNGEEAPDEDFNIDTSLDDEDDMGGEEDAGGDLEGGAEEPVPDDNGGEEAPNQANTNIFVSLTADEQQIKIKEMKKLYKDLYSSVNDLIHRIDNMELDEDIMEVMTKVSNVLHHLQDSIADYFENMFNIRSYFENDVKYNEFLLVLKKTTTIVDDLANSREKRIDKDSPNSEDKNSNI